MIPYYRPRKIDTLDFLARVRAVFEAGWFTNAGEQVRELERRIAELHHTKHCIAVCNGTIGLQLVLKGLDLTGEVITTPFTFVATAHAVQWQGLKPVFADIHPRTLTIDPEGIERLITPMTTAILGVHVFGQFCDVDRIADIAGRRRLKIVYDAAHNFLSTYRGVSVGNFGDAEVLSFHATKIFHTFEGGAILTNDDALAERLRLLKNFGFKGIDIVDYLGINAKMNEISAAFGVSLLPSVPETIARLQHFQSAYRSHLKDVPGLALFEQTPEVRGNGQYLAVFIEPEAFGLSRDQLWAYLWDNGIQTRRYFYPGLYRCEPYRSENAWDDASFPVTSRVTETVLCLPCYFDLSDENVKTVCQCIREACHRSGRIRGWYKRLLESTDAPKHMQPVVSSLKRS
jgi:dTDP-4-amino-4,6-dideoxygalactose transaminase